MKKLTQIASRVVLLIVAIAVFAVSFGAANPVSVSADSHRVVKVRLKEDLITLDPAHVGKPSDHVHAFSIYSGLVRQRLT